MALSQNYSFGLSEFCLNADNIFFLYLLGPNKRKLLEDYLENVLDGNASDLSDIDVFTVEDEGEAVTLN